MRPIDHADRSFTGFILAGGRSSRFGRPKADLPFGRGTLLQRMIDAMIPVCREVVIVGSAQPADPRVRGGAGRIRSIPDYPRASGPLAGIAAGLASLQEGDSGIFAACDLPFLSTRLISLIGAHLPCYQAVVPRWDGLLEPLVAGYSRSLLEPLLQALERGEKSARSILDGAMVLYLDGPELASCGDPRRLFFNVNTVDDYQRALEIEASTEQQASNTEPTRR